MPKVSVIVPIFRAEKHIERCARSLFGQTLDDIEYIFVDDFSPDNSMSILSSVIAKYPQKEKNIIKLKNDVNRGVLQTRLRGIQEAHGDYIIHCDADDWVDSTMYEHLYNKAIIEDADIVWCGFYKSYGSVSKEVKQNGTDAPIHDILLSKKQGALWNHLVRQEIVRNTSIISPKQNMAEDMTLLLQYFFLSKKWSYINEPLYYYYQNTNSVSSGETNEKIIFQAQQMADNVDIFTEFLHQSGKSNKWRKELVYRKFFNKRWLLPAVDSVNHCRYWLDCHRDINFSLFINPYISQYEKIISLLVELRLYPMLRKIIKGR